MSGRIVDPSTADFDPALRPNNLDEYVGQERIKANLRAYIKAALGRGGLALYTLLQCGVSRDHPSVQRAVAYLDACDPERTYAVTTMLLAYDALRDGREDRIEALVEKLLLWQKPGGDWGDYDLALALQRIEGFGLRVRAVVAGHMHHRLLHPRGAERRRFVRRGETLFVKFPRRSHVEQTDRPLVVREPGFDSLSINTKQVVFSAKRLTPVSPKL